MKNCYEEILAIYRNTITILFRKRNITPSVLTPFFSRRLPEKMTVPQVVIRLPAFYGTQRFITAFTRARYLRLS
jgi:hypothetical protein